MSWIALVSGRDVGIFVAVNRADFMMFFGLTKAANDMLASLAPRRPSSEMCKGIGAAEHKM